MKPYLIYGSLIALANSVVTLVLYLAGLHSDPDKLSTAGYISMVAALATSIPFMVAGVRTKRNLTPPTDDFTYGMALGVAIVVGLFATVLSTAFQFVYQSFINPGYAEVMIQSQIAAMQAKNIPAEHMEKAEGMMRMMLKPAVQAVFGFVFGTVFNVLLSLIIAAIMRRKAIGDPASPPAL
jgi:tetrahydromethanopterin S-methyltransferase subunit B